MLSAVVLTILAAEDTCARTALRLQLPVAIDSPVGQNVRDFARQVEADSGGALVIEIDSIKTYDENEVVSAVSAGAIDIGAAPLTQFAYDVPLARAFLQPFVFNFDALVQAATHHDSPIRRLIEDDILFWTNARVLWLPPYGANVIVSRNLPMGGPGALRNRAIGTPDDPTRELIATCGGKPHLVTPGDLRAALEQGQIEAMVVDIMAVGQRELWQAANTITDTRHAPSLFVVVVNDRKWQSLSPAEQAILTTAADAAQTRMWERFAAVRAEAFAQAKGKGMTLVAPIDVAAWRACSSPLLEAYVERAGDPGTALFAAFGKLRTEPCCRDIPK
jgi:TRAP-type C4-dicarboxylate transport system substrate-binding protein